MKEKYMKPIVINKSQCTGLIPLAAAAAPIGAIATAFVAGVAAGKAMGKAVSGDHIVPISRLQILQLAGDEHV